MAGPTPLPKYPYLCEISFRTVTGECPICQSDLANDWSITHKACHQSFCADCLLTWVSHSQTDHAAATCPLCRSSLGFLKDNIPMKTYIVNSLDELRSVVGDEIFLCRGLASHVQEAPVACEDIDLDNVDPESVKEFNVVEHVRNVLNQADKEGRQLNLWSSDALESELAGFEITAAFEGQDQAIDLALRNRWVINQLHIRQQQAASEEASRLLFKLNGSCGIRYLEAWQFAEFDTQTTFYIPILPALRVLGSITQLRTLIAARQAHSEFNQAGAWLDTIFTTDQLRGTFKLDTSDGQTGYLLERLPQQYDLEGWAIFQTDDMDDDTMYAVPRARFLDRDHPLRRVGSFFVGADGPDKMITAQIDYTKIPAGMMETWIDLWGVDTP